MMTRIKEKRGIRKKKSITVAVHMHSKTVWMKNQFKISK